MTIQFMSLANVDELPTLPELPYDDEPTTPTLPPDPPECGLPMPGGLECNDAQDHKGSCSYISGEVAEKGACLACGGPGSEALPRAPGGWYSEPDYATCGVCGGSGVGR